MPTILSLLKDNIIPLTLGETPPTVIVGGKLLEKDQHPCGVRIIRKKLTGTRRPIKGPREYGNSSLASAHWKPEYLIEVGIPKLFYVLNGQADFQTGDVCLLCDPGTFVLVPPGVPHPDGRYPHLEGERRNTPGERCDLMWFMPLGRGIQCWLCHSKGGWYSEDVRLGNSRYGHTRGEECFIISEPCVQIFNLLVTETMAAKAYSGRVSVSLVSSLLNILLREMEAGNILHSLAVSEGPGSTRRDSPIGRAQYYIRNHLHESLTIERVARHCLMSKSNFTQHFRSDTGESFIDFLTRCRLEEAKNLLRESDWSIARISAYVGLRSPSYFGEVFARETNMTPTRFRQAYRKKHQSKGNFRGG
jgi:AraC-like DNA-binding protein